MLGTEYCISVTNGAEKVPGLIILEVILKVTVPQMLSAGRNGRREAYLRYLRILALFFFFHIQEV